MNIGLLEDNSVKFYKNDKKMIKDIPNIKYVLLDISTALKGPIYTLIRAKDIPITQEELDLCKVKLNVTYVDSDAPFENSGSLVSEIPIKNISNRFSIYPLLEEFYYFNFIKESFLYIDNFINVYGVSVFIKENEIEIDNEETEEDEIYKIFKDLKLKTFLQEITDGKCIIISDKKWYFVKNKNIPKVFDYIIYNTGRESAYLLSYKEYLRLKSIENIEIKMRFNFNQEDEYMEIIYDDENYTGLLLDCDNKISIKDIDDILDSLFLFFPQAIQLERIIYGIGISLEIEIETKFKNYKLSITEKEVGDGLCLFKIINKLLTM